MKRLITLATAALVALATIGMAPAGAQEDGVSASFVTIVHGIPGVTVDVYVEGNLFLEDFEPETITDPVILSQGEYDIEIYAADADPAMEMPVISVQNLPVPAGADAAVVAHLDADGNPTATLFPNETSEIADGEARVTLRHTADAPQVSVYANDAVNLTEGVTFVNGEEAVADVPADTYDVAVTAPDDGTNELAPLGDVTLEEGVNTIAYAIGTFPDTFKVIVDAIPGLGPDGAFTDDNGSVHEANIGLMARAGITLGCNPPENTEFCPTRDLTRGEMAAFLVRSLNLPPSDTDAFPDDDESIFEDDINALAEAGITQGRDDGTYGPDDELTRGEMAAFLNRAFVDAPAPADADTFTDDDDSIFEGDIEAIYNAGLTQGCNPPDNTEFCPDRTLIRAEMATFLARALGIGS